MSENNVTFAKVVATPTLHAWSQAYNAGKLFAVLSLTKEAISQEEDLLPPLGKEILGRLEEEYFTLEEKNLTTIKGSIKTTCEKIPNDVSVSFSVVSIIDTIMYVFVVGDGRVILKRGKKIGTILDGKTGGEQTQRESIAASGQLTQGDIIMLQTHDFVNRVAGEQLHAALDHHTPLEIAEALSPLVHEQEAGGTSAIILQYQHQGETVSVSDEPHVGFFASLPFSMPPIPSLKAQFLKLRTSLTHRRKMFISIVFILVFILIASVFFALKKQEEAKMQALFQTTTANAQKKYEEGNALLGLNKSLAREDLEEAKTIIQNALPQFKTSSEETKALQTLSKKVDEALAVASAVNLVAAQEANSTNSPLLFYALENSGDEQFFAQDNNTIYALGTDSVSTIDKKTERKKAIITNKNHWSQAGGIGVYLTNVYVLDKTTHQILKFVPSNSSYGKTNYLKNTVTVDFSTVSSMTIDTSIWVLFTDGSVKKFTRGNPDTFTLSGLEKPLLSPMRIFTSTDTTNLYILDTANERIVVFNKEGIYQAQYQSPMLAHAQDFDVQEKQKKIYFLSDGKIWEIAIK